MLEIWTTVAKFPLLAVSYTNYLFSQDDGLAQVPQGHHRSTFSKTGTARHLDAGNGAGFAGSTAMLFSIPAMTFLRRNCIQEYTALLCLQTMFNVQSRVNQVWWADITTCPMSRLIPQAQTGDGHLWTRTVRYVLALEALKLWRWASVSILFASLEQRTAGDLQTALTMKRSSPVKPSGLLLLRAGDQGSDVLQG